MAPVIEKVLDSYQDQYDLVKVDADNENNEDLLRQYDIRSIPTLIVLNSDGQFVSAKVGELSEAELKAFLDASAIKADRGL